MHTLKCIICVQLMQSIISVTEIFFFLNKSGTGTLKWMYFKLYELRNRLSFITIQINVLVQYIFSCLIINYKPVAFLLLKTV